LPPNFRSRTGYRLPTEEEFEYACRAGVTTSRPFGRSVDRLREYAWFLFNAQGHSWPVASLKPNDFGLFDLLGNTAEWCEPSYPPSDLFKNKSYAVIRGGAYPHAPLAVRSARRLETLPYAGTEIGFRIARTLRP